MGTVLLMLRGTPFIYEGEELGYTNVAWPSIDDYNDLNAHSQYQTALDEGRSQAEAMDYIHRYSRDNARTPMQWNGEENAGFTAGTPWMPVHPDYKTQNAEGELANPLSVLAWYVTLVDFRKNNAVIIDGDYAEIDAASEQVYAFTRENEDEKILVAVNFTGDTVMPDLSGAGLEDASHARILLSSYTDISASAARADLLRPYEAIVVRIR